MKILALDASTKDSGYAVFEDKKLITSGHIPTSSTDLVKRIYKMIDNIKDIIINNPKIEKIILEEVLPEKGINNLKTHKALMYLQAAITFLIHDNFPTIEIEYVYPSSWRKVCNIKTGRGVQRDTLKRMDIEFVKNTYGLIVDDDEADAIGIGHAYTHPKSEEINWT